MQSFLFWLKKAVNDLNEGKKCQIWGSITKKQFKNKEKLMEKLIEFQENFKEFDLKRIYY